jgi:hypothetical protein
MVNIMPGGKLVIVDRKEEDDAERLSLYFIIEDDHQALKARTRNPATPISVRF